MSQTNAADNTTANDDEKPQQAEKSGAAAGDVEMVEKPVLYWQCEKKTTCERVIHLKNSNAFTDVILKFQPTGEIKAHSVILAMTSPVFERMFYGDFQKRSAEDLRVVEISDVKVDTFQLLIGYIYGDMFNPKTIGDCMELHKLADMYLMDHLKDLCVDVMLKRMTSKTAPAILNYGMYISNQILQDGALVVIKANAMEVLKSDAFLKLGIEPVRVIITECRLVVNEICLFTALVDWSVKTLKINAGSGCKEGVLRDYWKTNNIFTLIHFERMAHTEFGSSSKASIVFRGNECFEILGFLTGCGTKLPAILASDATTPVYDNLALQYFAFDTKDLENLAFYNECTCTIDLTSGCNVFLLGFKTVFDGKVQVSLTDASNTIRVIFADTVDIKTSGGGLDILFNEVVHCSAKVVYSLIFKFKLGTGNSNSYYNHLYGAKFQNPPMNQYSKDIGFGKVVALCMGNMPKGGLSLIFKL